KSPVGVLTKALTDELVPPGRRYPDGEIPAAVDAIVARAMAKKREERYAGVEGLRADLERVLAGATAPGRLARPNQSTSAHARLARADLDSYERSIKRKAWVRTFVVPTVLVGSLGGGLLWWRDLRDRPQTVEREPNNDLVSATPIAAGATVR